MNRRIVFVHVQYFYVAAERRRVGAWAKVPLAVQEKGRLIDLSPEALAEGISLEHTPSQARRMCQRLVVVTYDEDHYRGLFREVWDVLARHSPIVEPTKLHEGYADLTGCLRQGEAPEERLRQIREEIESLAGPGVLKVWIGMAGSKLLARQAAFEGAASGNGKQRRQKAGAWLRQRQSWSKLQHSKNDNDRTAMLVEPVKALYPPREIGEEAAFEGLTDEEGEVLERLLTLAEKAAWRLEEEQLQASGISLTLVLGDGKETERQKALVKPLFGSSRALTEAENLLKGLWKGEPVLGMSLRLTDLGPRVASQLKLFSSGMVWWAYRSLEKTMEDVRRKFGMRMIGRGAPIAARRRRMAEMILEQQERVW